MTGGGPGVSGPTPHFFVDDLERLALTPADHHHLQRVLRLRPGDPVTASDGVGGWRHARLGASPSELDPAGPIEKVPAPSVALTVCFALVKGERPELVVQKLTELGVDRIVPFAAARSVVRWNPDKAAKEAARLALIARGAAMQSRRCWLPTVNEVTTFTAAAALPGAARCDAAGQQPSLDSPVLLVGPEGGWSDEEHDVGLPVVRLGDHVMRAETAAIAAGVLLTALRARIVTEGPDPRR